MTDRLHITPGRFQPPHVGHALTVQSGASAAHKNKADHWIVPSRTEGNEQNPIPFAQKIGFLQRLFPGQTVVDHPDVKNLFGALRHAAKQGYKNITVHAGEGRAEEYEKTVKPYIKSADAPDFDPEKHLPFTSFTVLQSGKRSEGGEGVVAASGTRARKSTRKEYAAMSATRDPKLTNEIYNAMRKGQASVASMKNKKKKRTKRRLAEEMSHDDFKPMMDSFAKFAANELNLKKIPKVHFKDSYEDCSVTSFGGYNPHTKEIILQTKNRHPMDIFRTLAHEFVHAKQHEDDNIGKDIEKEGETGSCYENEANAIAGVIMRKFGKANPKNFELEPLKEAIFIVGGPCSGKDKVVRMLKEQMWLPEFDITALTQKQPQEERVVINAPAHDLDAIRTANQMLKDLNYKTSMIFVDVENNISKLRNEQRANRGQRVINESVRFEKYSLSQKNLEYFVEDFDYDILIVDNTEELSEGRCWKGYRPVKGKTPFSKGSCEKVAESLHDWFKSRSPKTGARGWVQVGGKYDGYPCARQEGQKSTPKCRSSEERAKMSKKEKNYAFKKKNREDPNQPEKSGGAKPTMVKTYKEEKDACYHKVKARYDVFPSAYASGALVKCRKSGAANWGNKSKKIKESFLQSLEEKRKTETQTDKDFIKFMEQPANREWGKTSTVEIYKKMTPGQYADDKLETAAVNVYPTSLHEKKDCGCEHDKKKKKVLRKRLAQEAEGGAQLGTATGYGLPGIGSPGIGDEVGIGRALIGGLVGVSPMSAGTYMSTLPTVIPESVQKWMMKEETQQKFIKKYRNLAEQKLIETAMNITKSMNTNVDTKPKPFSQLREAIEKYPSVKSSTGSEPGGSVSYLGSDDKNMEEDWSDTKHQDPRGGLKASGVRAYRRENPGSKLKTAVREDPSKLKKGGKRWKRRKSFCSRMKGMKAKLTSAKTARDPDSRINKSLRAWNCEE